MGKNTKVVNATDAEIESLLEEIQATTMTPADQVAADVEAILEAINEDEAEAPSPAPTKPRRTRQSKKSAETTADATAGDTSPPAPSPAVANQSFAALLDPTVQAELTARMNAAAKKVREKAENAIAAIDSGKRLSRFTKLAIAELVTKREITSADLTKLYTDAGLSMGTARAQGQQMTALFRMFGLTEVEGRTFKLANEQLGKELAALAV